LPFRRLRRATSSIATLSSHTALLPVLPVERGAVTGSPDSRLRASATPDGIDPRRHIRAGRAATPLAFAILGGLLAAGLIGLFGGDAPTVSSAGFGPANLSVRVPATLRNGEFFEMEVVIDSRAAIDDATVAFDRPLWRNITINTVMPAAVEESFEGGGYRMAFGPLDPGDRLVVKLDGQINPPMFKGTEGRVRLFDGDRPIGDVPIRIKVMP
jgi:hypothetical protein